MKLVLQKMRLSIVTIHIIGRMEIRMQHLKVDIKFGSQEFLEIDLSVHSLYPIIKEY